MEVEEVQNRVLQMLTPGVPEGEKTEATEGVAMEQGHRVKAMPGVQQATMVGLGELRAEEEHRQSVTTGAQVEVAREVRVVLLQLQALQLHEEAEAEEQQKVHQLGREARVEEARVEFGQELLQQAQPIMVEAVVETTVEPIMEREVKV